MSEGYVVKDVTAQITKRSKKSRDGYLAACEAQMREGPRRWRLSEGNVAHASVGCAVLEKTELLGAKWPNIGIVTAYNDMLSAHAPFERFPELSVCFGRILPHYQNITRGRFWAF